MHYVSYRIPCDMLMRTYHSRHISPTRSIITPTMTARPDIIPTDTPTNVHNTPRITVNVNTDWGEKPYEAHRLWGRHTILNY